MEPKVTVITGKPEVPASTRIDSDERKDYEDKSFRRVIIGKEIPAIPAEPERVVIEMDRATAIALRDVCGMIGGPATSRRGLFDRLGIALREARIPSAATFPVDVAHHYATIYFK